MVYKYVSAYKKENGNMEGSIYELIAGIVLGALGLAFSLQYYLKGWKSNKVESSLISMMHKELERYAKQNKELCDEVEKLRVQLRTLNTQLSKIVIENERLHTEVSALSGKLQELGSVRLYGNTGKT